MNENKPKQKRYLVEIRGVLHVDALDGQAAHEAALAWIESVSAAEAKNGGGAAKAESPPKDNEPIAVCVGWLRPFPE